MVRLGLTADLLEVEELEDVRVDEDVVAPARPAQLEAERLDQASHVGERDVRKLAASDPRKEPLRVHDATLSPSADGFLDRRVGLAEHASRVHVHEL